jgi:uncharacterized protein DUF6431
LPFATGPDIRGLNTPMPIVVDCGDDVERYLQEFATHTLPRPSSCPHCTATGRLIGHGSYPRQIAEPTQAVTIRVQRLLCTACGHTLSLLPSFCLAFRHYATATIQTVLALRIEVHASWREVRAHFQPAEVPTLTTCREWVDAFRAASARYLPALLRHLARWAPRSRAMEVALADLARHPSPPSQLVAAVPHLLVALHEAGVPVAKGSDRWLATLWQWGNGRKLGGVV